MMMAQGAAEQAAQSAQATQPTQAAQLAQPVHPTQPEQLAQAVQLPQATHAAQPAQPPQATHAAQPAQPPQATHAAQPAQPPQATHAAQPAQPPQATQLAQATQPAQPPQTQPISPAGRNHALTPPLRARRVAHPALPARDVCAADLHLHSVFSDGLQTPAELCAEADRLRLTHLALCDHDTLDGLDAMEQAAEDVRVRRRERSEALPFTVIPGIELSSGPDGRTHILGYGAPPGDPALCRFLREAEEERAQRAEKILDLLASQGAALPDELRARVLSTPRAGRAHIARALVEAGAVHTLRQAFDRYLGEGKSAYVPRRWLDTGEAVLLLTNAGAVPVLAHPARLGLAEPALYALVQALMSRGLRGLEVYHPSAGRAGARKLDDFARRKGLLVTGGSDAHGDPDTRVRMGRLPSGWTRMSEDVAALLLSIARA